MSDETSSSTLGENSSVTVSTAVNDKSSTEAIDPTEVLTSENSTEAIKQRDEYYDLLLRKTAEFDNYRKRIEKERSDLVDYLAADVLRELLPLLDDLERALASESSSKATESYRKGVEIIHKQLLDLLRKRGVTPLESIGTDFDPHVHQAVMHEVSTEHREGEIIEEFSRGYMLGKRLLRPAMVKVAKV